MISTMNSTNVSTHMDCHHDRFQCDHKEVHYQCCHGHHMWMRACNLRLLCDNSWHQDNLCQCLISNSDSVRCWQLLRAVMCCCSAAMRVYMADTTSLTAQPPALNAYRTLLSRTASWNSTTTSKHGRRQSHLLQSRLRLPMFFKHLLMDLSRGQSNSIAR